tara:strand:- start:2650 stop:3279 length:630 start_codon:yes stop_codon:yes gene_type:complete
MDIRELDLGGLDLRRGLDLEGMHNGGGGGSHVGGLHVAYECPRFGSLHILHLYPPLDLLYLLSYCGLVSRLCRFRAADSLTLGSIFTTCFHLVPYFETASRSTLSSSFHGEICVIFFEKMSSIGFVPIVQTMTEEDGRSMMNALHEEWTNNPVTKTHTNLFTIVYTTIRSYISKIMWKRRYAQSQRKSPIGHELFMIKSSHQMHSKIVA